MPEYFLVNYDRKTRVSHARDKILTWEEWSYEWLSGNSKGIFVTRKNEVCISLSLQDTSVSSQYSN